MMRTIYLIGLNHKYQLGPDGFIPVDAPPEAFDEFDVFLRAAIADRGIRGIAEEMSRCALKKHFVSGDSIPCWLAAAIGLPHRYCDPDAETQKALNITSDSQREEYWIKELISFDRFPLLFILGTDHISSFEALLPESHFQPCVIVRNWEPRSTRTDAI